MSASRAALAHFRHVGIEREMNERMGSVDEFYRSSIQAAKHLLHGLNISSARFKFGEQIGSITLTAFRNLVLYQCNNIFLLLLLCVIARIYIVLDKERPRLQYTSM